MVEFDKVLTSIQKSVDKMSVELTDIKTTTTKIFKIEEKESKERTQQKKSEAVEKLRKSADDNKKNKKSEGGNLSKLEGLLKTIAKNTKESKSSDDKGGGGFDLGSFLNLLPKKKLGGFAGKALATGGGVGPYKVPGVATGDKHPMLLPTGSFVLNRRASQFLQSGGIAGVPVAPFGLQEGGMTPVVAESRELVFPPSAYTPFLQALNSSFPRFQNGGPVGKDSSPPPKDATKKVGQTGVFFKPTADVKPGGSMSFTGDGSGFTGEIKLKDGAGIVVAQIGGVSGVSRTAETTQEERKNISGTLNPIPDGKYPLEPQTARHPGQLVGDWSAWVNNPSGTIGNRGQIYVHNDLGSDGTAGCIGVEAGGVRGSKHSKMFAEMYDLVQPKHVSVNLASSDGGQYSPGGAVGGGGSDEKGGGSDKKGGIFDFTFLTDFIGDLIGPIGNIFNGGSAGNLIGAMAMLSNPFALLQGFGMLGESPANAATTDPTTKSPTGGNKGAVDRGGSITEVSGSAGGDMVAGAKKLMEAGVPKIGAAYLAGNIQQESSWNGQRDWGQVMGDGTSRNGGLVSWASWSDNPARLGKIEKHLGKNIKEASDGEQINAMLWEMKRDYPKSYATFMNPKATDAELRDASYKYWGFGHEGARYEYAQQALQNLQKGGNVGLQIGGGIKGLSPVVVESGETIFAPGTFGPEIPMMNASIPRFANGGMVNNDTFINDRFKSANELHRTSQIESSAAPIIIPMPMGGGGGGGGGGVSELPIPTLSNGPSSPLAQSLLMQSYSLMRSIG